MRTRERGPPSASAEIISIVTSYTSVTYNTISVTTHHHVAINIKISATAPQEVMPHPGKYHLVRYEEFMHNTMLINVTTPWEYHLGILTEGNNSGLKRVTGYL